MGNRLITEHDAGDLLLRLQDTMRGEEFFLFPLDWGGPRATDIIDEENERAGVKYVRFDVPVSWDSEGAYRTIQMKGRTVKQHLKKGEALTNTRGGLVYKSIQPIDFKIARPAVVLDDWLGYTGQGLLGALVWGIDNREILNLKMIYPAAFNNPEKRTLELPEKYSEFQTIVGELQSPYHNLMQEFAERFRTYHPPMERRTG